MQELIDLGEAHAIAEVHEELQHLQAADCPHNKVCQILSKEWGKSSPAKRHGAVNCLYGCDNTFWAQQRKYRGFVELCKKPFSNRSTADETGGDVSKC